MKLAIHKTNWGFSGDWIKYCESNRILYKIVNCYSSDIIEQIKDCDVLLWHHHHTSAKDFLFAKQLLFSIEQSGKKVFPEFKSGWHFDDKVGQKYLLEAINAPIAPTWVFYERNDAINWAQQTTYPKVFKLRGGAGSTNVKLVDNYHSAKSIINKAFGSGFPSYSKLGDLKENLRRYHLKKTGITDVLKSFRRILYSTKYAKMKGREKGYVLFQDFIPDNSFDIRIVTIGNKACGLKRLVRKNDFRASGSGFIEYEKEKIDERCVQIAFQTTEKLGASCLAYDFVFDKNNNPLIVEINYGFAHEAYFACPGYWDKEIKWHQEKFNLAWWIIEVVVNNKIIKD